MTRKIDTRDFSYFAGQGRLAEAKSAAAALTGTAGDSVSLSVRGESGLTGSPKALTIEAAPPVEEGLIEHALKQVREASAALGFAAATLSEFTPDPNVYATSSGSKVVHLHQHHRGIPVFGMTRTVRYTRDNRLRSMSGDNVEIPPHIEIVPKLSAKRAMVIAAQHLAVPDDTETVDNWGQPLRQSEIALDDFAPEVLATFDMPSHPTVIAQGPFGAVTPLNLVFFPQGAATRLAWRLTITMPDLIEHYIVVVAADDEGLEAILYCQSSTHAVAARGNIYTHNPGQSAREMTDFPPPLADYPVSPSQRLPSGFPQDWVAAQSAQGNNTRATLGASLNTLKGTVLASGVVEFDPVPEDGDDQKILNIFFFCNYMHDFFYLLGFDEASGNFQSFNFTGAGAEGDPVRARAHSGPVPGTANMSRSVDGSPPIMNMGLVAATDRHTAFDSDVVFHEFAHGVTNRLVGGRMSDTALDAIQSGGMGEGWGDYFALTIQNYSSASEKVVTGDWVVDRPRGIRVFPYDENFPDDFGKLGSGRYNEVHNIGEIWCATLMDLNRRIGGELGDAQRGHRISWQIVVDALKLSSVNPSFLEMRDAILDALDELGDSGRLDDAAYASSRRGAWTAFAKFGMGPDAISPSAGLTGIVADFGLPEDLPENLPGVMT